jgi:hypothetical protein
MAKIPNNLYYSPQQLFTYNRFLNFLLGGRGIGKSFSMKQYVINRFIKRGEQFVYLRRYKTELKHVDRFFQDLLSEGKFTDHSLEVKNREFFVDSKRAGYALPLSTWLQNKSDSYPSVTTIIFDEFLIEKGNLHYLQNEVDSFLNMVDTIVRNRDNVRVVLMANATTVTNPYFIYFGLQPDITKRFNVYDSIVIELPPSKEFAHVREQTAFGKLIRNTEYGSFSLDNKFKNDSDVFIETRSKNSMFLFGCMFEGQQLGVWIDYTKGRMYVSYDIDPSGTWYAMTTDDHTPNLLLMRNWRKNSLLSRLAQAFTNGYLRFDNQNIKNLCYTMFRHMNIS